MTRRAFRPGRTALWRRGLTAGAVVLIIPSLAGGCSAVRPADDADDTSNASAGSDSFGAPALPGEVKQGGRLVMALSAEPDQLDPTLARSLVSRHVFEAICEKLYDVDAQARIVPQLAAGLPKVSDGGRTVKMSVRDGVKFADGTPLDAAAVKATFERNLSLGASGRRSELGPITGVEAPDARTVVVHLKTPFAPLTAALVDRAGMIMSPTALKALGQRFSSAPICVGPFKLTKRVPQNSIELSRDPYYYDADKVHLDSISYRIITDANIRAANLRSGDVQVADTLSAQDVPSLLKERSLSVLRSQSLGYQGVTFNVGNVDGVGTAPKRIDRPSAQNPKVRQAFEYAIDRAALVKVIFNDLFVVACSPISPRSQFSSPAAQKCAPHDPAKARQLLSEAGVRTPYLITMITANNPDSLRFAQALQSMVKDGGFDLRIQPVEFASLLDQQDRGDFELLQLGWSGRVDPDANITNFLGTGASQNVSGYSDPRLDAILERARQSQNVAQRSDLYAQAVVRIHAADPIIYLYRQRNFTGVSDTVKGVQMFPDGIVRLASAGIAR